MIVRLLVSALIALAFMLTNVMVVLYAERKIIGHMQVRLGPMRTGWHGLLQSPADVMKLLTKEDVRPQRVDRLLWAFAPALVTAVAYTLFVAIPWGPGLVPRDLGVGAFFVLAISSLTPLGIVLGGWASNNKYSLLGGLRGAAQEISYEVPMFLAVVGVIMQAGSLRFADIVAAQHTWWNIFGIQVIGFAVFMTTAVAEMNRTPFDLAEAESELIAGFATEYSGMRWGLFFVAEYSVMLILCAMAALLYLGGWSLWGLPVPGWLVMTVKTYALVFFCIWLRATLPRVRVDQLMDIGWKVLLPVSLLNIVLTGLWIYASRGGA